MDDVRRRIYPVTRGIWLGPFASPERRPALVSAGVTHLLNVGEAPGVLAPADGPFREAAWHPIEDLARVPDEEALACLATLHRMACEPDARVYVHCIAGRNRSPTVVWLYLVACGVPPEQARGLIEAAAPDAVAGHSKLVDAALVEAVTAFGTGSFRPHPRPEAIEPSAV